MDLKFYSVLLGTWFLFMILAIINAGIRNGVYKPIVGDLLAHQISTVIFIVLILFVTYIIFRFTTIELTDNETLLMGVLWLVFTMAFEFLAGHYIFGSSWEKIFADYNILKGRIWSLVLVTLFFTPYISQRLISLR
jgi:hypothetical protein